MYNVILNDSKMDLKTFTYFDEQIWFKQLCKPSLQ